ncbi:hypothetical protein AM588_10010809 [Phytophthora nicotianae]|uniref:Beta-catenin-like protein 1 N-terminal domain-containing protein n=1 Tax=Phytophthora nicotianae TaxID=4792 RepID=A0A0W8DRQ7_PHYNI|nr:hypothetical protein AM588_10010809 [Phytophthora nicotianae]
MIELQVPRVLLGLFAHDNLDIRLAVLSLLAEVTDVDDAAMSLEPARMLTKHLVDEKLLPLLVTNLYQLAAAVDNAEDTQAEEETTGIYNSLQILENMADLEPQVCVQVAETSILPFLLKQVSAGRKFSENKLYASEILSILLQSGAEPREKFVSWMGKDPPSEMKNKEKKEKVDLMDDLLQALAPYRKKDPGSEEEEELVGNLKASKVSEKAKEEENAASLVASMCAWVRENAPADGYDRLHAKFVENDMEKVDRLVDLFAKYHERVERSGLDEEEEDEDEDSRYLRRLDAGLFVLERIAFVVAHLCRFSKKLRAYVMVKFHERSIDNDSLVSVLQEQLDLLVADDEVKKEG